MSFPGSYTGIVTFRATELSLKSPSDSNSSFSDIGMPMRSARLRYDLFDSLDPLDFKLALKMFVALFLVFKGVMLASDTTGGRLMLLLVFAKFKLVLARSLGLPLGLGRSGTYTSMKPSYLKFGF